MVRHVSPYLVPSEVAGRRVWISVAVRGTAHAVSFWSACMNVQHMLWGSHYLNTSRYSTTTPCLPAQLACVQASQPMQDIVT